MGYSKAQYWDNWVHVCNYYDLRMKINMVRYIIPDIQEMLRILKAVRREGDNTFGTIHYY
jgi:hypothetical protein